MVAIANINSTLFAMNTSLLKCQMFSKIKDKLPKLLTFHPLCDGVTSVFLEGVAEGAIAVEPTLLGEMATEIGQRSSTRLHGYKRSAFRQDSPV